MSLTHFRMLRSHRETTPEACETAATLEDALKVSEFRDTQVVSANSEQSIENAICCVLKSHILRAASLPTLTKKDPSKLGLIDDIPYVSL